MIAFIGMGLLGSNFVKAMLRRGEKVNVWNRTHEKAQALEEYGATSYNDIQDAVRGAERVHLTLKDDAVVNDILAQMEAALMPGCLIIDHTTTTAQGAAERTELWKTKGFTYVHAPVFMGPQNALESTGVMLISGAPEVVALVEPIITPMTGKVVNFGTKNNTAAGMKLIGNLFLITMTAGLVDALLLSKALGIDVETVNALFSSWNPAGMLGARLAKITNETFNQPTWELNMARKDARLMMEEAQHGDVLLKMIPAIAAEMDQWIAKGFGNADWTVIGKDSFLK